MDKRFSNLKYLKYSWLTAISSSEEPLRMYIWKEVTSQKKMMACNCAFTYIIFSRTVIYFATSSHAGKLRWKLFKSITFYLLSCAHIVGLHTHTTLSNKQPRGKKKKNITFQVYFCNLVVCFDFLPSLISLLSLNLDFFWWRKWLIVVVCLFIRNSSHWFRFL